jgi:hypothetical protein
MDIDNPCPHTDCETVLVASDMLPFRIFLSPYMAVSGVENAVLGKVHSSEQKIKRRK